MILSILSAWLPLLSGASFDCAKAKHPVEQRICADSTLSSLDDSLASAWKSLQPGFSKDDARILKTEQRVWLGRVRDENPGSDTLRSRWKARLADLDLKRELVDLRWVADPKGGRRVRLESWGSCTFNPSRSEEGGGEVDAVDALDLAWDRTRDRLRFVLDAGVQPSCHECGKVQGEAKRFGAKSANLWRWEGGAGEERMRVEMELTSDEIRVRIVASDNTLSCGAGASLPETMIFRRAGVRVAH